MPPGRPLLIYDGDCGFCAYWVRYWQRLTGDRVEYAAYQQVGGGFPDISSEQFRRSIYLITPEGGRSRGAEAAFRVLARAPGKGCWLTLYRRLPGYARFAELAYTFVSRHRSSAYHASRLLWGGEIEPARHDRVIGLFLCLLGLTYAAAFASFGVQALGLVGSQGILPLPNFLALVRGHYGTQGYWLLPTLFWFDAGDTALQGLCATGTVLGVLLAFGRLQRITLPLLYGLYLSLFYAGQAFTTFQWDLLLLETGFLGIFLPTRSLIVVWLLRWLAFRFVFLAGAAKILSHDPTWAHLTALDYHFLTQPLPSPLGWYAHYLPAWAHQLGVAWTLLVEIGLAFLIFFPRRLRFFAAWCIIVLQLGIIATGSYNFFNLLTCFLCVPLFDDQALAAVTRWRRLQSAELRPRPSPGRRTTAGLAVLAVLILLLSGTEMYQQFTRRPAAGWLATLDQTLRPLQIVNTYGLFANMTTERAEIVIEGSNNGRHWAEYEFRFKPGALDRAPRWNIPHQPRLDWQMWFAALADAGSTPWFENLLYRLLENSPPVVALLGKNPFSDRPPKYVRALLYDYRYSSPAEHRQSGQWWVRELRGTYYPAVSLREPETVTVPDSGDSGE